MGPDAILGAALRSFYKQGYYGSSIRDIARESDMTPASLYHHFESKQEILRLVMTGIMKDALATTQHALLRAGAEPSGQLAGLVRSWVLFHAHRQVEARVGATQLHCLEDDGRRLVVALRDEQERMFRSVVERGVEDGVFATPHPREAARAIVNMGTAVATWFRLEGGLSPEQLADTYAEVALSTVQASGPG